MIDRRLRPGLGPPVLLPVTHDTGYPMPTVTSGAKRRRCVQIAIHAVSLSGGAPTITHPAVKEPYASAVHDLDALASGRPKRGCATVRPEATRVLAIGAAVALARLVPCIPPARRYTSARMTPR